MPSMRTITQAKTWWKLSFLGGFAVFLLAAGSILLQAPKVYASCDNVNIIHCGLSGSGQLNSLHAEATAPFSHRICPHTPSLSSRLSILNVGLLSFICAYTLDFLKT